MELAVASGPRRSRAGEDRFLTYQVRRGHLGSAQLGDQLLSHPSHLDGVLVSPEHAEHVGDPEQIKQDLSIVATKLSRLQRIRVVLKRLGRAGQRAWRDPQHCVTPPQE